jgi:hypothetical protein
MLASRKKAIDDLVIESLAKNPYIEGPNLVALVKKSRPKTTKQAVYIALNTLLENEVAAKVGSTYFISRIWLNKIHHLFKQDSIPEVGKDGIFNMKDGESISYHFPSMLVCDTYWAHLVNVLIDWIPKNMPSFIWNPHDFFVIGRNQVEIDIFEKFKTTDKYGFFIIGGNTTLDKEFKKTWTNSHVSINIDETTLFANNHYLNIFDDFIIEVYIDIVLATKIEGFYKANPRITLEKTQEFEKLLSQKYPVRMKISRKKKKALALRKKLAKDFYIPPHLKGENEY